MNHLYCLSILLTFSFYIQPSYAQIFTDMTIPNNFGTKGQNRGVAIGDFNNDGWEDVYISNLSGPNLLYENKGNFQFEEVSETYGLNGQHETYAALWFDMDNDGDQDLFLANFFQKNVLYRNEGGRFIDVSGDYGIESKGNPKSILAVDYNQDGFLDVYIAQSLLQNILWRNEGGTGFTDVTDEVGIVDAGRSLGAVFLDYDLDGDQDLFQTRDGDDVNLFYQNNGDGSFTEIASDLALDFDGFGMGADFADLNGDLYPDIYLTNLFENKLYLSTGDGIYAEQSAFAGVDDIGMGWSTFFFDCNNDGEQDLYLANESEFGVNGISPIPNRLFINQGNMRFFSGTDFGAEQNVFASFGAASADFDLDGQMDIVVSNSGSKDGNQLFRNNSRAANYIAFECEGSRSNRDAIGTRVVLFAGERTLTNSVRAGSGYASQGSKRLHFGLGNASEVDSLIVFWPSGIRQIIRKPEVNKLHQIYEEISLPVDPLSEISIIAFPNPVEADKQLTLITNTPKPIERVALVSVDGRNISLGMKDRGNEFLVNIPSNVVPGIYVVQAFVGKVFVSEKIFIE